MVRVNSQITAPVVRVIDVEKCLHDSVPVETALKMAVDAGLDLVEVNPRADPPVCKIFNYEGRKGVPIDARYDVIDRRVLAQGATPEQWAVEVAQPIEGAWTTTFYVGAQGFRLADSQDTDSATDERAEQHCAFIGEMFVKALRAFLDAETEKYRTAISRANDQLFDSRVDDPQHQVDGHTDTLPAVFLALAAGHDAALETLQTIVREWVEPEPTVGLAR